jgi:hypothetical protein
MVLMSGWIAADALDKDGVAEPAMCGAPAFAPVRGELVEA